MITISNFINKIIRKNILFGITLITINWHFITSWVNITDRGISFNDYLSLRVYTCIIIGILTMINVLFYMRKHYDSIKVLCKNEFEYFLGVSLAIIKNNFIFSCIPFIYMISYSILIRPLHLSSIRAAVFIMLFEWFLPLSVISIVISFLSIYIKKLILKLTISSLFLYITSTKMLNEFMTERNGIARTILKALNIFDDQAYAYYSDFVGEVVNTSYIIDKFIPVLLSFTLIIIAYIKFNCSTYKSMKISIVTLTFLTMFLGLNIFNSNMTTYIDEEVNYNRTVGVNSLDNFEIETHNIQAYINNKSKFKNKISIVNVSKTPQSKINFLLDDIFKIGYIHINGNPVKFNHKNNLLTLNLENSIKSKEKLTIEIGYSGYINVQTQWNEYLYIATKNEIMLPMASIAWFPKVNQSSDIRYKLSINSNKPIYSNLSIKSSKRSFMSTTYNLSSTANDIALYAGDYKASLVKGVNVIHAADSDFNKNLDTWYNEVLSGTEHLSSEKIKIDECFKNNEIEQVIISRLGPSVKAIKDEQGNDGELYLEQLLLDDTLIINKLN